MKKGAAFPSQYLSKEDVADAPVRATIADVRFETIKGDRGSEDKPVLSFKENGFKPMILNSTNWGTIEDAYGDESDNWRGKSIELYLDPGVMFGDKRVGGVRVRIPNGKPAPTAAPAAIETMTWEDAKSMALEAGLNEKELKAVLKKKGLTGWNLNKDGPTLLAILKERQDDAEVIPFDPSPPA